MPKAELIITPCIFTDSGTRVMREASFPSILPSETTSRPLSWDERDPSTLAPSARWTIHPPPVSARRQHCSGSRPDSLFSAPSNLDDTRLDSDIQNYSQSTSFGGGYSDLMPNPSYQIRAFERFPQSPHTSEDDHHIMEGGPETSPFVDGHGLPIHAARLGPYSTSSQHPSTTSQLPVGMHSNFPNDTSGLASRTGSSAAGQSKPFPLSPPVQPQPHRSGLAYPAHQAMQGLAAPAHNPQPHNNISTAYALDTEAPHLRPHPGGRNRTRQPTIMDPLIPQTSGAHEDATVHQFFVTQAESHRRLPAQVTGDSTRVFSHEYNSNLSIHGTLLGASQPTGYMSTNMDLPRTDGYRQQCGASTDAQLSNYGQVVMSSEQSEHHLKESIITRPPQPRTASSNASLSRDSTTRGDSEEVSTELDLAYGNDGPASPSSRLPKKARAAFTEDARRETGETRKIGACIRCRFQRSRCIPDPDDPNRECKTCGDVRKESKKVVHRLPCLRWKIMDIVLSRIDAGPLGSLRLTERWQGFTLRDVSEWVGEDTRTINITLGICSIPLVLQVRKFKPRTGDVTYRCWRDGNNEKRVELAPYALASIKGTTQSLKEYLNANALKTLEAGCRDQNNDQLIRETYWWVIRQHENLKVDGLTDREQPEEWKFLADVLRLWMAIKHTIGSSYLCGTERLGMEPKTDDQSYPLFGRISTPRMVVAQNDSILASEIIAPLRRRVLKQLEAHLKANKPRSWFTLYLAVFLLLHNTSVVSADRRRHGRENGASKGYSLPRFVEELHIGANVLLAYWSYYRTDEDPLEVGCLDRHRSRLMDLTAEQFTFIQKSCKRMRDIRTTFKNVVNWDDQLYWVCRMFDKEWEASPHFIS
ncbi:hypothetical protein jhhlp_002817 [Lomentospora prolificans]|uniref:Zn(2)-C6 fungal-type domain-containing protein n=1 Tax=Lomentospora prolificans TaxID=41688 RepID=A0A2N3NEZ6_9PEZI|nr:hypothetical protein jhhlp_002817 [Lomentospora prolificans]